MDIRAICESSSKFLDGMKGFHQNNNNDNNYTKISISSVCSIGVYVVFDTYGNQYYHSFTIIVY